MTAVMRAADPDAPEISAAPGRVGVALREE
jgi:hypothetical protein